MKPSANPAQGEFCAALLDPALPCPPGLVAWNGSDVMPRLAVYRNNVISSLVDALGQTFPVVLELVGVAFFRAMASEFVRAAPPRSHILAFYGAAFPHFMSEFGPARPVPYLADVARLDLARVRVYHAADAQPVAPQAVGLAMASQDRVGELRLDIHPAVQVVQSPFAIVSLWAAHQDAGDPGAVDPVHPESALVLRDGLDVLVLRLSAGAAEFITALQQQHGLAEAVAVATDAEPAFDLQSALVLLLGHGAVTSIGLPGESSALIPPLQGCWRRKIQLTVLPRLAGRTPTITARSSAPDAFRGTRQIPPWHRRWKPAALSGPP